LVVVALGLFLTGLAFGQDTPTSPNWNGNSPQQAAPGFVAAHTFYWMLGVGGAVVSSLSGVIGILWVKLGKKEEDDRKDVLLQVSRVATAVTKLVEDWDDERKDLRDLLRQKDDRLEKQHEKTLKIAVRAQQAVEAMANLPIGENMLDDER
jgi:hypothetical protein